MRGLPGLPCRVDLRGRRRGEGRPPLGPQVMTREQYDAVIADNLVLLKRYESSPMWAPEAQAVRKRIKRLELRRDTTTPGPRSSVEEQSVRT